MRAQSFFGLSFVYVIFDDGTDMYWARSRVLEYMQSILGSLPEGVTPRLGPDATGVGWVYQYVLLDETGQHNLQELRSFQDWYLRYWLQGVPGVAEVATVGGYVKQYQITLDPDKLRAYNVPLRRVIDAVRRSNNDVGGKTLEIATTEYFVRGRGYVRSIHDLETVPVGTDGRGTPVYIRDLGQVTLGPDIRRGLAEWNGQGEVVGGIVVMRFGENALDVIEGLKTRLDEVQGSLPPGVKIVPAYDRTELILRAIENLTDTLKEEIGSSVLLLSFFYCTFPVHSSPSSRAQAAIVCGLHPDVLHGDHCQHHVDCGGIAHSHRRAVWTPTIVVVEQVRKKLEQWDAEGRRAFRMLSYHRGDERSGRSQLLFAAGYRRRLSGGIDAVGSGGPAVQAPRFH